MAKKKKTEMLEVDESTKGGGVIKQVGGKKKKVSGTKAGKSKKITTVKCAKVGESTKKRGASVGGIKGGKGKTQKKAVKKVKESSKKKPVKKKRGRPTTLTQEVAESFMLRWRLAGEFVLCDKDICEELGVPYDTFKTWLEKNKKVKVMFGGKVKVMGFKSLRTRARASVKIGYITRIAQLSNAAERNRDFKTAAKLAMWVMEKMFRKEFGNQVVEEEGEEKRVVLPFKMDELPED